MLAHQTPLPEARPEAYSRTVKPPTVISTDFLFFPRFFSSASCVIWEFMRWLSMPCGRRFFISFHGPAGVAVLRGRRISLTRFVFIGSTDVISGILPGEPEVYIPIYVWSSAGCASIMGKAESLSCDEVYKHVIFPGDRVICGLLLLRNIEQVL